MELKYVQATVDIDRSSDDLDNLSISRNPEFQTETLLLKVLIEGHANLYSYVDNNLTRFFFSINNEPIAQLVYKNYYIAQTKTGENNLFRQQLLTKLTCQEFTNNQIKTIRYSTKDLLNYFNGHNKCMNIESTLYQKPKQKKTHFTVKAGLNMSWSEIVDGGTKISNVEFKPGFGYTINLEMEHIMSFNKNKWSFVLEPGFNSVMIPEQGQSSSAKVIYNAISIPLGVRYSLYLNKTNRIMLNAMWNFDFAINSTVNFTNSSNLPVERNSHLSLGLGFKLNRYMLETSYHPGYDVLTKFTQRGAIKSDLRFSVGYTIF